MRRRRAGREKIPTRVETGVAQWQGTRPGQNDFVSILTQGEERGVCMVMADGIGTGQMAGAAAKTAVQTMLRECSGFSPGGDPGVQVIRAVGSAHQALLRLNERALDQGMMSTGAAVGCILLREEKLSFCSVGNVRIFLFRAGEMLPLNRDFLLSTEEENRAILDGGEPEMEPDWNLRVTAYAGMDGLKTLDWPGEELSLLPGDQILMMSSGIFGLLSGEAWSNLLERNSPQAAADEAIARVKDMRRESQSNVSVAILRLAVDQVTSRRYDAAEIC